AEGMTRFGETAARFSEHDTRSGLRSPAPAYTPHMDQFVRVPDWCDAAIHTTWARRPFARAAMPTFESIGLSSTGVKVLIWMCALIAANQLGFGAIVPVIALYAEDFDVSQTAIGLTIAVYGLARFLVSLPAGRLSDLLGRKPTLAI